MEMKLIGLLGGMSWESSVYYYSVINRLVNERIGGHSSGRVLLNSVNFDLIQSLQKTGDWPKLEEIMAKEAKILEQGGSQVMLICTNTMHNTYDAVTSAISIPVLHIADTTGEAIKENNLTKIGLLGTIYTMEKEFYKGRLTDKFELDVLVPEKEDRVKINEIIFKELVFGKFNIESKEFFKSIIEKLIKKGAQGIILGCTEIPLLIKQEDVTVPVFDTTYLHAKAAVDFALQSQ